MCDPPNRIIYFSCHTVAFCCGLKIKLSCGRKFNSASNYSLMLHHSFSLNISHNIFTSEKKETVYI